MFPQQPQQQFRTSGADVQFFYGTDATTGGVTTLKQSWNKPVGVSHIYMMLIGGGGVGDGSFGGGSGAVTVWYGAAQYVPNSLVITNSVGDSTNTTVSYYAKTTTILLTAAGAVGSSGGLAMTANQFTASGFFQSVQGQQGSSSGVSASSTTFLGGGAANTSVTGNYGYTNSANGYFQLQPIIVGLGCATGNKPGIGCGNGASNGLNNNGGTGFVLIASW